MLAGGALLAAATGAALVAVGPAAGLFLAVLPLFAIGVVYVVTTGQVAIYAAAIALPMIPIGILGAQLAGSLYPQDLIAALALAALLFATFLGRGRVPPVPRTPVLGWPLVLFAIAIFTATLRGHYEYGASLVGQPLRLFLYAAIVAGLIGMTVPRLYRLVVWLFYSGVVLIALSALYYLATGGSATDQFALSTGGTRLIPISTSLYSAGGLFLALLNLRLAAGARERVLHVSIAATALFGVIAGFGRAAYIGVLIVGVVFLLTSRRLRLNVLSLAPLALPFVVLLAIGATFAAPDLVSSVRGRVSSPPSTDANVQWRVEANRAVLEQVREQPLVGSGFGRTTEISITVNDPTTGIPSEQRFEIGQDPHNGYVFLLAGGGVVTLATFLLILLVFALDAVRRYRASPDPIARLLILWSCATLFVFLFNAVSGTSFASPVNVLTIWALLVLPAAVQAGREEEEEEEVNAPARRVGRLGGRPTPARSG